jgi:hypothetical protein
MVEMVAALGGSDCEGLRAGWLAQPANAVSSFAYVAAGLWLLWRSRRAGVRRGVLLAGAAGLGAVGIASVAYHGPQPGWAHFAHEASVAGLALLFAGLGLWLATRVGVRQAASAIVVAWRPAAAWMVPALAAYGAGRTGSALCDPGTVWQVHAVWHGLSAVSLGLAVRAVSAHFIDPRRGGCVGSGQMGERVRSKPS